MAIALEVGNAVGGAIVGSSFSDINASFSHSLQNSASNDRLVIINLLSGSSQTGDLSVSLVTYDGVAPTKVIATLNSSAGAVREVYYTAYWDDGDLPAGSGSYTVEYTISGNGSSPVSKYYVIERTGINQTTPDDETSTNIDFGTTQQTHSPSGGDNIHAMIAAVSGGSGSDITALWTDIELFESSDTSANQTGFSVAHSTSGSIGGTLSAALSTEGFISVSLNEALDGGPTGIPIFRRRIEGY